MLDELRKRGVSVRQFDHATEFVAELAAMPARGPQSPVFKGVNALWTSGLLHGLTPAALRAPARQSDGKTQRGVELMALQDFAHLADSAGLPLPGGLSPTDVERIAFEEGYGAHQFPVRLLQLAALAQHHRLPTRLLDFTDDPFVAMWFASEQPSMPTGDHLIAVWLVPWVSFRQSTLSETPDRVDRRVCRVDVARAHNPRLHAQSATFLTLDPRIADPEGIDAWYETSDLLPFLRDAEVWVLGAEHRGVLRRDLAARRYSRTRLYADYDSAALEAGRVHMSDGAQHANPMLAGLRLKGRSRG